MSKGLSSAWKGITGESAAEDIAAASETQAAAQREGLAYLQETEAIPQELRQAGLQRLGGIAGLPGFEEFGSQQQLMDQAQASPFYQGQLAAGQEATARLGSAQGGFRGGSTLADIGSYTGNLRGQSYQQELGQLQGLAQLPSQAGQISQGYGQIGQTLAQGQIAGSQAQQQGMGNIMGLGGQLGAAYLMSDINLKDNIVKIGETSNSDIQRYKWDWKAESGKTGSEEGFLAQEVEKVYPDLVITLDDGYKRIYKDKIEERLNAS